MAREAKQPRPAQQIFHLWPAAGRGSILTSYPTLHGGQHSNLVCCSLRCAFYPLGSQLCMHLSQQAPRTFFDDFH
jgi:hypothetical protein